MKDKDREFIEEITKILHELRMSQKPREFRMPFMGTEAAKQFNKALEDYAICQMNKHKSVKL